MAGLVTEKLNKFGPFGRYNGCVVVSGSTQDFSSGSLFGASAIIISGSTQLGHVDLARGGRIQNNAFTAGTVYELGVASVTSLAATENIIVLLR